MIRSLKFKRALLAGFLGTGAMTLLMYGWPLLGLPKMDVMVALGSVFPFHISPYFMGALVHLLIGASMGVVYAIVFEPWLPGPGWLRGALFSFIPWIFAITLLGPALQMANDVLKGRHAMAANPCAVSNPCSVRPSNPCAAAQSNPCAVKAANPCGAPTNPCATANPCGGGSGASSNRVSPQVMSLVAHLVYGLILGIAYRPWDA